jgi:hypothetical protein
MRKMKLLEVFFVLFLIKTIKSNNPINRKTVNSEKSPCNLLPFDSTFVGK